MENNMVDSVFKGMLNPEVHEQVVELENLLRNSGTNQMSLYIESDDLLKLEEFSKNVIELLKGMNLISYPARRPLSLFLKQYLMTKTINCVVIDAIEEDEINKDKWELLKQNLKDSHIFTIFLTTKEHGDVLRKQYSNDFFNTFDFVIRLKPYSISEIISGAEYALENSGLTYDKNTFLPAYEEWIRTVYHRADLQGEAFVEGIIKRLIRQSMKLNQDGNVTPESIPVYWKRELSEKVQNDIEDKYSKYTSIKTILNLVQTNKEHDVLRNAYNLCIETNNDSLVKDFARDYARLLNSQNYDVIYSTFVEEVDVRKLIEMDNLQNQHGLIVVKGLDDLDLEDSTSKAALDCLLENISNSKNDLVWIVNTKMDCIKDKLESFKFIEKTPSKINVDKQECDINEIITILGKSQSNEFSHEIYVDWNGKEEKIASFDSGKNSFEYAYTIPLSFANDLPNQTEGKVSFRLDTYYNGEFIGSNKTSDIRVIIPETYKSVVELVEVVKEDGSKLDEFKPNEDRLKFKIHVNGSCGATIKSIQTSLEGKTYLGEEFITDPIEHGGELNYKVEIVDSRNRVTTKTGSINVKEVEKQVEEKLDPIMHPDFLKVQEKENQLHELVKDIKSNPNEKNVLLLAMSTLPGKKGVTRYFEKNSSVDGNYLSQLEPVPKMLAEVLSKEDKKIDYIYVLNSWQTENKKVFVSNDESKNIYYSNEYKEYTAFEYFKERCASLVDTENIINISLEKVKDKVEVSQALYDFTNQLIELTKDSTINLYVDIHGGLRDSFTVVDSVLMLMKNMYNVNLVDMYSVKQKDVKTGYEVVSVKNEYTIYDFVGGMHEFLSFGRSNGLIKYVEEEMEKESDDSELHEKNQALVDAINMFSDGISLNQAGLFSDRLSELAGKVNGVSYKKNFGIVKQLISNNYVAYIDKIENKNGEQSRYDLLGIEKNYLPAQLKWCLDKDLLQQTLTLIESVMIEFLISEGIVSYPECIEDYKDAFDDWVNLSLFEYGSNRTRIMKCNGEECEMYPGQPMSYFKEYTEFFCRMDNDLAEQGKSKIEIENEILRRIYNHRNRSINPNEYYLKCENSVYRDCQYGIRAGRMRYEKFDIPLVERLRNNSDYVDEFYKLLFIHRGLKMYRNKVSHANAEESIRLSKDDLRRWIELYIEVLDKLMRDAKELLNTNS
ncbi:MAG TPA: hypothetical protein DIV43_02275 [Erysipelotrichaceae bacterium]|nr:hypothetical protein [Erysipelotrichaceae bacterium]